MFITSLFKVSFDDFQALIEIEDSSSKKMKITSTDNPPNNNPSYPPRLDYGLDGSLISDSPIIMTPQPKPTGGGVKMSGSRVLPETPTVILRHKPRSQRRLPHSDGQFGMLSPISSTPTRPQSTSRPLSNEFPGMFSCCSVHLCYTKVLHYNQRFSWTSPDNFIAGIVVCNITW